MPKDNKRGDTVASPRSSARVEKKNIVKKGEQHQQEFTDRLRKALGGQEIKIECEGEANVFSDFAKFLEKEINKNKLN